MTERIRTEKRIETRRLDELQPHRWQNVMLPDLADCEFDALVQDMKDNGQLQEIEVTLDNMINNAVIIEKREGGGETVEVGSTVTVKNQDGAKYQYTLTGSAEADPPQGKISNVSPIGKGLLGKKVGEITEVNAPSGKIKFEILAIK